MASSLKLRLLVVVVILHMYNYVIFIKKTNSKEYRKVYLTVCIKYLYMYFKLFNLLRELSAFRQAMVQRFPINRLATDISGCSGCQDGQ